MAFCTKCGNQLVNGRCPNCDVVSSGRTDASSNTQTGAARFTGQNSVVQKRRQLDATKPMNGNDNYVDQQKQDDGTVSLNFGNIIDRIGATIGQFSEENDANNGPENTTIYENGKKIVPDCVANHDGEVPIKQYDIARLRTRIALSRAYGRLMVTNKRVIFRAAGKCIRGRTRLQEEFEINEIAGVEIKKDYKFNVLNAIGGLFLMAICISIPLAIVAGLYYELDIDTDITSVFAYILALPVFIINLVLAIMFFKKNTNKRYYGLRMGILSFVTGLFVGNVGLSMDIFSDIEDLEGHAVMFFLLVISALVNLFFLSFSPTLKLLIKTKGSVPAIDIRRKGFSLVNSDCEYTGFQEVLPWTDTDLALAELGTMIDDIQTMGDAAISKWQKM